MLMTLILLVSVQFRDLASGFTINTLNIENVPVVESIGSCQGTVIILTNPETNQSNWAGTCHGNEQVIDYDFVVDGQSVPLVGYHSYQATTVELNKQSILFNGSAQVLLQNHMYICEYGIIEQTSLTALTPVRLLTIYGWMSSHPNNYIWYAVQTLNWDVQQGLTTLNDDHMYYLPACRRVHQYDPNSQIGILTNEIQSFPQDQQLIWDRSTDNKLYWSSQPLGNFPAGSSWSFRTTRTIQSIAADNWLEALNENISLISSDVNLDGRVDLADFARLQQGFWVGDVNNSGAADAPDVLSIDAVWSGPA